MERGHQERKSLRQRITAEDTFKTTFQDLV
jgi:hypothetical protein